MLEIYVFESSFAVIFCSLCRLYHIGLVNFGLLAILIERGLAIYFVTDYEMKSRPYIGVTLGIVTIALSIIAAPLVSFEYVSWTFGGAVIVLGISSAMSFLFLLYRTQLRYKRIVAERLASNYIRYSLSFRFQLNENIRSMKLLRNLLALCAFSNLLALTLFGATRIEWMSFHSNLVARYYEATFELVIACYASSIPVVAYYSDDIYKGLMATIPLIKRFIRVIKVSPEFAPAEEGAIYFTQLQRQWNKPANRTTSETL
ncbi:hypothetical protein Q1695_012341 [Nippostrongylus brasiliensis]|nr:hypothetical protein Q1695_012341 [Nippostrongylus brasiliensis]